VRWWTRSDAHAVQPSEFPRKVFARFLKNKVEGMTSKENDKNQNSMNTKLYCIARQLAVALWLVALSAVHAQTSVQAWVKRYSHTADSRDYAEKVVTDNAGNAIVAGSTDDGISGGDFLIIKYSGAGVPLWTNRYKGPANGDDRPQTRSCLAIGPDGSVYVTGASDGNYTGGNTSDFATVKYITVPVLAIERSADDVILSWPSTFSNFVLQECMDLVTINWTNAPSGINNPVTVPATEPARFYRLRQQ
jgi:hypothetical protein